VDSSIFAFATDLADEGIETVLENVQTRAGLGGVTIAASYHDGRDLFPHNPVRRVRFLESCVFFRPKAARWRGLRLQPPVSQHADVFADAIAAAERRDLAVNAWSVFLHNGALAAAHPDCAPENAFGDGYVTDLCPANPDARAFACALAADIAGLGVRTISAESLHYDGLEHGYAHERYFIPLSPRARYLLGLCFCKDCLAAAGARGVDGEAVRAGVRDELERVFAGNEPGALVELEPYERVRAEVVTSLVAEATDAARTGGARLEVIAAPPERAWQVGLDVAAAAAVSDGIQAMGYAPEPERVRSQLESYADAAVSAVLRPMPPDCDSPENLRAKVEHARELGLSRVDFYHYGFMRLDALDWIRAALAGV
jgi:hypothetical protein